MRLWDSFWCQVLYLKMKMLRLLLPRCSEGKQLSKLQKTNNLPTCTGRRVPGCAKISKKRTSSGGTPGFVDTMQNSRERSCFSVAHGGTKRNVETSNRRHIVAAATSPVAKHFCAPGEQFSAGFGWSVPWGNTQPSAVVQNPSTYQRNPTEAVPNSLFFTLDLRRQEGKGFETQPDKDDFLGRN